MKKEAKHTIDYFLKNPDFISWVKNPTGHRDIFWKTWLENHPKDKENFHNAKTVLQRSNFRTSTVSKVRQEEILGNILTDTTSNQYQQERSFRERFVKVRPIMIGSAAILLLFVAISFFISNSFQSEIFPLQAPMISKYSPDGERMSFYLSDSTLVILNSGSTLQYPVQFNGNAREVKLVGEAYFDVKHSLEREFLVRAGNIVTQVHGTSFNVNAYKGEIPMSVSLERGSVSVHSDLDSEKKMTFDILPGEKLTVETDFGRSVLSLFNYESEFGWKDGVLVFNDSDLSDFISTMERWYGININVVGKSEENWAINGRFKKESFENVLKSLEFSRKVIYRIKGNQVTLYLNNNQ